MELTLNLPPELEERSARAAQEQGLTVDEYARRLLEKAVPAKDRQARVVALLQSWMDDGDAGEQRDTGAFLVQALDEDRLSDRKLFPPELKGLIGEPHDRAGRRPAGPGDQPALLAAKRRLHAMAAGQLGAARVC
jgi:hypothetical protein